MKLGYCCLFDGVLGFVDERDVFGFPFLSGSLPSVLFETRQPSPFRSPMEATNAMAGEAG